MEHVIRRLDSLNEVVGRFASVSLIALILLVIYDTSNRYLFSSGSIALQELEWHLFDVLFLAGLSYALKHDSHVRVDIFYEKFHSCMKEWINITGIILFIFPFSIFILYGGFEFSYASFAENEISPNPGGLEYRFVIKSFISLGFVLLILQAFSELAKSIVRLNNSETR